MSDSAPFHELIGNAAWLVHSPTARRNAMSSSNLSRRAILAGASVVPVLTLSGAALAEPSSDAELLELGQQFEAAWRDLNKARSHFSVLHEEVLDATEKLCPDLPESRKDWTSAHASQYNSAQERATEAAGEPYRRADDALDAAFGRCDDLSKPISKILPTTIAGAGVRARVAMYVAMYWWDGPEPDLDADKGHSRLLIEALCTAAGLPTSPDLEV
jgi:hypothetical protein